MLRTPFVFCTTAAVLLLSAGCSSILSTSAGELAGIASAAVAGAVTSNPGVAAGIGLGAQAGARAGVDYAERRIQRETQDRIAHAAGPLTIGEVASWSTDQRAPLAGGEQGRVTVSRVLSLERVECKEIVFSVDYRDEDRPRNAFYVAMVCREGAGWKWASAEPATARWGGLQ
jgi:hypothetical protein